MTASHKVIGDWIAQWNIHFVEPAVFGTANPHQIADLLNTFCHKELGTAVADYLFYASSIGAVCGVRLVDNRRVVVEELVDEGVYHQAHDPAIRRSMAEMLAWLIQLTRTPEAISGLQPVALDIRLPPGVIWPPPHSKIFDFEATATGAEWIDEIARKAQEIKLHGAGQLVLGHIDWGVKHFRYINERVRVIYDWDSLSFEKEPIIVGHASGHFTYTEFFGAARAPTNEETQAFIAEYEAARDRPFTSEEMQTLEATKLYGLAYGARCEHALHPDETSYPDGSCRSLLTQYRSI